MRKEAMNLSKKQDMNKRDKDSIITIVIFENINNLTVQQKSSINQVKIVFWVNQ